MMKLNTNVQPTIEFYLNQNVLKDFYPYSCKYTLKNNLLTKHFEHKTLFEWETYIYTKVKSIAPKIETVSENYFVYDINNLNSIRQVLKSNDLDFESFCENLFEFIENFATFSFIHGNLTKDNIFMNENTSKFYVIDFTHSALKEQVLNKYTDFYYAYNSLSSQINRCDQKILDSIFNSYVPVSGY